MAACEAAAAAAAKGRSDSLRISAEMVALQAAKHAVAVVEATMASPITARDAGTGTAGSDSGVHGIRADSAVSIAEKKKR